MSARAAKGEVLTYVAAAVIVTSIVIVCLRDTGSLLATRRSCNGRKKSSCCENDCLVDSDIKILQELNVMLDVVERDIIPLTCVAVCQAANMNKLDGAAVLLGTDYSLLVATTNQQARCPLYTAAIVAAQEYYEGRFSGRIRHIHPKECVVILTHKPCELSCYSLIVGQFGSIFYLFDEHVFPGSSSMSSSYPHQVNDSVSSICEEYSFRFTSISKVISDICDGRRVESVTDDKHNHRIASLSLPKPMEGEMEGGVTVPSAKSMAISAAVDALTVITRRRIDQLKSAYCRINEERLLQKSH